MKHMKVNKYSRLARIRGIRIKRAVSIALLLVNCTMAMAIYSILKFS